MSQSQKASPCARWSRWVIGAIGLALVLAPCLTGSSSGATFTDTASASGSAATAATIKPAIDTAGTAPTYAKVTVTWTPSASAVVGCQRLQRATTSSGPWSTIQTFADRTTATYVDSGVTPGSTYYYRILAAATTACYWPTPGTISNAIVVPARAYLGGDGSCDSDVAGASQSCIAWGVKADGTLVQQTIGNVYRTSSPTWVPANFTAFADSGPYVATGSCDSDVAGASQSCIAWGIKADGTLVQQTIGNVYRTSSPTWVPATFTAFADSAG